MRSWLCLLAIVVGGVACGSSPKYPSCDGDKDCKEGEHCNNKQCSQCATDDQCGAGRICKAGGCQPIPGYCDTNAQCTDGQVCENHACVSCKTDNECPNSGKCTAGKCLNPTACTKDDQCADDEDCVSGFCQKGGGRHTVVNPPKCALQPLYFGFNQYSLDDSAKGILQKNFECMQSEGARGTQVVGYTDPRGTEEYNVALSDDRAQAVITYLARLGVDPTRLHKVPKGSSEAKGTNETGWAQDRRVEFVWQ